MYPTDRQADFSLPLKTFVSWGYKNYKYTCLSCYLLFTKRQNFRQVHIGRKQSIPGQKGIWNLKGIWKLCKGQEKMPITSIFSFSQQEIREFLLSILQLTKVHQYNPPPPLLQCGVIKVLVKDRRKDGLKMETSIPSLPWSGAFKMFCIFPV